LQAGRKKDCGVTVYFNIAQIILSVALIAAILLQSRGGGLGDVFGGGGIDTQYKTRRGLERTLFQVTIGLAAAFLIVAVVNALIL
jgi:preprotein translocase subunit SecG